MRILQQNHFSKTEKQVRENSYQEVPKIKGEKITTDTLNNLLISQINKSDKKKPLLAVQKHAIKWS